MMSEETAIQEELQAKFPQLQGKITIPRERRIFVEVTAVNFAQVFDYAVKQMNFNVLCTITGLDNGPTLGVIYHLARENRIVLNLATELHKIGPIIPSVISYFPSAEIYEREMVDLLGVEVRGLPPGSRYPLPDDWPKEVYPLRKDWNLTMLLKKEARQNG
jgi:NADH:ubiquinone oxidoreductase subunit C